MITRTVTRTVARGIFANRSKALPPRTGLLLYLRTPNGTGAAAGKYVATAGSASIFAALGSDWYTDVATPKALTAAEILALASVNDYHILFSAAKGLAIYDPYTTAQADIDKAHAFYRVSIYADDVPTAFFNGLDTTGMTSYTGGPTYAPDHLGVLRSPGAGRPAIEGMRLATTLADGAVLGPELVVNGTFADATGWTISNIATIANGTATLTNNTSGISQSMTGVAGKTWRISYNVIRKTYTGVLFIDQAWAAFRTIPFAVGPQEVTIVLAANVTELTLRLGGGFTYTGDVEIDNISVQELIPTYYDTTITGEPILPSVERKTRTGNTDFTEFIAGTTFKKYTRTNPATDMPGYLSEPARTNKVTCRKANPVDTTNVTKAGDAAAVLSVVDDTAALTAAGLMGYPDSPCTTGKVYKLDNSSGTGFAFVALSGAAGNINAHSLSVYARKSGVAVAVLKFNIDVAEKTVPVSTGYIQTLHQNVTPGASSRLLELAVGAGSVIYFILPQLEEGPFATSPICKLADGTDPLTAITRAGTVLTYPTAGKIRSNNMAFRMTVVPRGLYPTSTLSRFFGTLIDGANSFRVFCIGTNNKINMYKTIANTSYSVEHNITGYIEKDVPLELLWCQSSTYGMILTCRKYVNGDWLSWQSPVTNTTEGGKANIPVGTTYQLGSHDSILQHTGNISELDTLFIPEGITDPLAWAKAQWGLPA